MILHGKAKEDFLEWYGTGEHYFNITLKEIEQHANIIEWLDSVGVYVNVLYNSIMKQFVCEIVTDSRMRTDITLCGNSRKEATIEAIKKANEIYDEKFRQR